MTMVAEPISMKGERASGTPLLAVRDLRIEFRGKAETIVAVPKLSFEVKPGESFGLVGESGCGKSTTAMAIMGYLGATGVVAGGSIRFEGEELVNAPAHKLRAIRGRRIAMVYQDPMSALNPVKTVGAQLAEVPMLHLGASRVEALDMAAAMLKDVRLPDAGDMLKRYPHQLSGGQQQRVVIAMALLGRPSLLLLDEPTTGLDVTVESAVIDLIGELRRRYGTSLLFISHNLGLIAESCDRVGIMYSGELVEEAPTRELFGRPRHPYTQGLIDCIPDIGHGKHSRTLAAIPGHIPLPSERPRGCLFGPRCAGFRAGLCDRPGMTLEPVGERHVVRCVRWPELEVAHRELPPLSGESAAPAAEITFSDITKFYHLGYHKTLKANEAVSFEAGKAEIVALVGESGCGKSTLARIVTGLDRATSGEIRMAGENIAAIEASARPKPLLQSIQMVFQNPDSTLNPSHSAGFSIRRSLKKFGIRKGKATIDQRMRELLEMVRLSPDFAARRPSQLSGGQKQRIAIARAFASDPSLIVADEPVSALDVSVQAAVVTLLLDIQKTRHATMLFISHDLALVRHVADKVVVMYLGKVMEKGTVEEIFGGATHPYTEALISAIRSTKPEGAERNRITLTGDTPSPVDVPRGCRFASRCHRKLGSICDREPPPIRRMSATHEIACHIPAEALESPRHPDEASDRS
ncbi:MULTISPECIES: ABC transporter ATP-binding protein [unclassified Mesorhizobium]|uniref:dipeptide ABC transporter ATP-binding protein n=4 Tax=Mesorhizobium TaxID=68287 RepID=UPI000BAF1AF8|nr:MULTISPECIES: ABC transporter ATP-binding protein [unclassified Mesorhizobium]PBB29896.1 ABC transporter ATP-binding protein [Mesorhizobium sp. WSM3882]RUV06963.1 ABC transporter ATP-binding protein [Mesorhizobium sp. M1A.F.Ca.IN.020.03.2.1]RUV89921.1 ABC transporter ATP-binding protein [Mesorhizobium sp. M1A.F.Ca.IN.020.32.1.1]RWF82697.1 MAG: ABC transporter ATP-binding protein [Mesorhizobium sp.]RWG03449.1 MAG: ABC transporter ATP-binding protein [Mesorhizobium sp.]